MSLHATNRPADTWFCMSCSQLASGEFCSRRVGGVVCGSLRKFSVGSVGVQRSRGAAPKYVAALSGKRYATVSGT